MADIQRDVLIRITTEVVSNIKPPNFDAIKTGHAEVTQEVDALKQAVERAERVMQSETKTMSQQINAVKELIEALPAETAARKALSEELTRSIILREREAAAAREAAKKAAEAEKAKEDARIKTRDILVANRLEAYQKQQNQEDKEAGAKEVFKIIAAQEKLAVYQRKVAEEAKQQAAERIFHEIAVSEKLAEYRRRQAEEEKAQAARVTFEQIAVAERLASYRRQVAAEEEANQEKITQASRRALSQVGAATASVLQLGKGIALMSASTEAETQKIMKEIVAIQGLYDVAHGGVMVLANLAGAWNAVTVAATAAGVAQYVALGPVILAVAAIGAGLYALHKAFDIFQIKSREALEHGKKYAEYYLDFVQRAVELRHRMDTSYDSAKDRFGESTVMASTVGKDDPDKLAEKAVMADRLRAQTLAEINQRKREGFGYDERSHDLERRLEDQDRSRLQIQDEIVRGKRAELATTIEQMRAAERELVVAREKERSVEIALGHLTKAEQQELKRLNAKVGRGERLSDSELKRVERLGGEGVRSYTEEERRKRGIAAGGLGLISNLGGNRLKDNTTAATNQVDRLQAERERVDRQLEDQEKKLNAIADELSKSAKAAFDGMFNLFHHLNAQFNEQSRRARQKQMES